MGTTQRVLAGLAATFLTASCAAAPTAQVGPQTAGERAAARYRTLAVTPACACNAARGAASAQNATAFDAFSFSVVDMGTSGDLAFLQVFIGDTEYRLQAPDVATVGITGSAVAIQATVTRVAGAGPDTLAIVINFDTTSGAYAMTVNAVPAISGTSTVFTAAPGSCDMLEPLLIGRV